jgi:hypothetical protein
MVKGTRSRRRKIRIRWQRRTKRLPISSGDMN